MTEQERRIYVWIGMTNTLTRKGWYTWKTSIQQGEIESELILIVFERRIKYYQLQENLFLAGFYIITSEVMSFGNYYFFIINIINFI